MRKEHYSNVSECALSELITADRFRTVMFEQRTTGTKSLTEVPAELNLTQENAKLLRFSVAGDGILYGFVRVRRELKEKFGREPKKVYFNDWGTTILLVIEFRDGSEQAYHVRCSDLIDMMNDCLRIAQEK
ncbi:MAG: hypothetical protein IJ861_09295 [Clostridia bacterium]|nr:hypothetical protein [Clostridia bacterium]